MHARQRSRPSVGDLLEELPGVLGVSVVVHMAAERLAWSQDVTLGDRDMLVTGLSQQVSAKQCGGRRLEEIAAFPAVGQMRRVEPAYHVPAERQFFSILERPWWPVGRIAKKKKGEEEAKGGRPNSQKGKNFVTHTTLPPSTGPHPDEPSFPRRG